VLRCRIPEERLQSARRLFPGKTRKEVEVLLQEKLSRAMLKAGIAALVFFLTAVLLIISGKEESLVILRPETGETEVVYRLQLEGENGWEPFDIVVAPTEYTEEQIAKLHEQTEVYLDREVVGENKNFSEVRTELNFPEELGQGIELRWSTDTLWLLDEKGRVHNGNLEKSKKVTITAKIYYGTEFRLYERQVTVYPKLYTQEEENVQNAIANIQKLEEESRTEREFRIPDAVNGRAVGLVKQEGVMRVFSLGLIAMLIPLFVYWRFLERLEEKRKKQTEEAKKGYTELVTKFSLMLVAGISVRQIFSRLCREYEKTYGKDFSLTKELHVTNQALLNGCPEAEAYEAFGERIGLVSYQRMAALLTQNCSKGVKNIKELLLLEAKEVMAEARAEIRIQGEQAGTKLLLPMMGFLVLIFAILLVPAFEMF